MRADVVVAVVCQAEDLEGLFMAYPEMDQMLRQVYQRRKKHFQSADPLSMKKTPGRRNPNRRSSEPTTLNPRPPKLGGAFKLLSMDLLKRDQTADELRDPGNDGGTTPGDAKLAESTESGRFERFESNETMASVDRERILNESLGFGSPPREQESLESEGGAPIRARLFQNRVYPEESIRADPVVGDKVESPGSDKEEGNGPGEPNKSVNGLGKGGEERRAKGGENGTTEHYGIGNGTLFERRKGSSGVVTGASVEHRKSDVLSMLPEETSDDQLVSSAFDSLQKRRGISENAEECALHLSPGRRITDPGAAATFDEPSEAVLGDESCTGLGGIRTELRMLKQEVEMLRMEQQQDAARSQEQYKAMMSLMMKMFFALEARPAAS